MLQPTQSHDSQAPKEAIRAISLEVVDRKGFDFEFIVTSEMAAPSVPIDKCSPDLAKPTTSIGENHTGKRASHLEPWAERPKSSDSTLASVSITNSQIGLALGSPCYPVTTASHQVIAGQMSPDQHCHAFLLDGPLTCNSMKSRKWKLGKLFRSKDSDKEQVPFYRVQVSEPSEDRKLGLPIQRNPWRNPKSPAVSQNGFKAGARSERAPELPGRSISQAGHRTPAIEVSIPGPNFERYSIMFAGIDKNQSNLLTRRSRDIESLDLSMPKSRALFIPSHARRVTSPTILQHPPLDTNERIGVAKYSLFPLARSRDEPLSPAGSAHAPSNEDLAAAPPVPPKKLVFGSLITLDQSPGPTPRPSSQLEPREFHHSLPSSTPPASSDGMRQSSQSDIYFDVRSFRDSQGQAGQQFEMTRPPSDAVKLARQQSTVKNKLDRSRKNAASLASPGARAAKTTSVEIDEAIAVIESLTSPSSVPTTAEGDEDSLGPSSAATPQSNTSIETMVSVSETTSQTLLKIKRTNVSRSGRELNIAVPSPVIESTEEMSPMAFYAGPSTTNISQLSPKAIQVARLNHHTSIKLHPSTSRSISTSPRNRETWSPEIPTKPPPQPIQQTTKPHFHNRAQSDSIQKQNTTYHVKAGSESQITRSISTSRDSLQTKFTRQLSRRAQETMKDARERRPPRSSSLQPLKPYIRPNAPPPVPVKDSKYIPLSKYAPKQTTETLLRQTGLRPVRPVRSNTEDALAYTTKKHSPSPPTRSSTMPNLNSGKPAAAYIAPVAEVSVARTISLSRKASARVVARHEPKDPRTERQPSRTKRPEVEEQVTEKKVLLGVPVMQEVQSRHKPGLSMNALIETSTILEPPSPPPLPDSADLAQFSSLLPPEGVPDVR